MRGTLFVVATPIGNLEDITLRALTTLREVDLVAAEDTRRTNRLLRHFAITTPTASFHRHNESTRLPRLISRLEHGDHVALVTDAGTPTVSDPGSALVALAVEHGIRVEAIPGPSAILTALAVSGLVTESFTFVGFPPSRSYSRKQWFLSLSDEPRPVIFFEAPHRIRASLSDALTMLGDRPIMVGRELTKAHEELIRGPISEVLKGLDETRGEFTVIFGPGEPSSNEISVPREEVLWHEFGQMTDIGDFSRRQMVARLAKRYGLTVRRMYEELEKAKPK